MKNRTDLLPPLAVVFGGWVAWRVLQPGTPVFPLDDAYITLHNAAVLLRGADPNFGAAALVGSTSVAHVALVALLSAVMPPTWALETSLWLGVLLYATGVSAFARLCGAAAVPRALFTAAALLAGYTAYHLLNGLETGLAMGAIAWALVAAVTGRALRLAALCGVLPFLRPELVVLAGLLLPLPALRLARAGQRAAALRLFGTCALAAVAAAAPWLALSLWDTGSLMPATAGAKLAWFAERDLSPWPRSGLIYRAVLAFLVSFGAFSVLGLWTAARRPAALAVGLLFASVMIAAYWMELPGALFHNRGRYLFVLAPLLVSGAALVFRRVGPRRHLLISALLLLQSAMSAHPALADLRGDRQFTARELAGVASWMRSNLPPDAVLLIHDAGFIAWTSQFRMVDLVGLKTPSSIADNQRITLASGGRDRGRAVARIAARAGATHLVVRDEWDALFRISAGLASNGWSVEPLRTDGAYKVYRIAPPSADPGHRELGREVRGHVDVQLTPLS